MTLAKLSYYAFDIGMILIGVAFILFVVHTTLLAAGRRRALAAAGADGATVTVTTTSQSGGETTAGSIHVSIEDDGSGFHIAEVLSDQSGRRNLGIATLRQQAEALLRGEFGIESAVGRGTRVAAVVPLP